MKLIIFIRLFYQCPLFSIVLQRDTRTPVSALLSGLFAAVLSSAMGGAAVGATRFVAGAIDPLALGSLRFGIGFALLLPLAMFRRQNWPRRQAVPKVVGLGLLFFGAFPALFNLSLHFTTAARGALALSTLPLLTMAIAALLGVEPLTARKSVGVLTAMGGVGMALISGLSAAPPGAWRGDLTMLGAALCMAFYSVWSRPVIRETGPMPFTLVAMGSGALCLIAISAWRGGYAPMAQFGDVQWMSIAYLGVFGGAVGFFLWSYALARTTPTLVALSVTVNPIAAAFAGWALMDEPVRWSLVVGLVMVFAGIAISSTSRRAS
ncbi:DMT family transporter [Variovorax sp. LT1R20]|uniref:DMT family transporter n=1 Tax=Variovorax sp. LT1R20 TaxID=3443729 RepID=UPI003F452667